MPRLSTCHTYHSACARFLLKAPSTIWGNKVQVCSERYILTMTHRLLLFQTESDVFSRGDVTRTNNCTQTSSYKNWDKRNFRRSECHFNPGTRTNTWNERICYGEHVKYNKKDYCKNESEWKWCNDKNPTTNIWLSFASSF